MRLYVLVSAYKRVTLLLPNSFLPFLNHLLTDVRRPLTYYITRLCPVLLLATATRLLISPLLVRTSSWLGLGYDLKSLKPLSQISSEVNPTKICEYAWNILLPRRCINKRLSRNTERKHQTLGRSQWRSLRQADQ